MAAVYPWGKHLWYPLARRLGGPQSWSGHRGQVSNPGHPVCRQTLYWLSYSFAISNYKSQSLWTCGYMKMTAFWDIAPCSLIGILTSETLVLFSEPTWHCIQDGCHLDTQCCKNLSSHMWLHFVTIFGATFEHSTCWNVRLSGHYPLSILYKRHMTFWSLESGVCLRHQVRRTDSSLQNVVCLLSRIDDG
jgi:hypothetical protein